MKKTNSGFTLIELLVVISIISLLSSSILATVHNASEKAKLARLYQDASAIQNQVDIARYSQNQILSQVTGNACTACGFDWSIPVVDQPGPLNSNANSWRALGFPNAPLDPWRHPYLLDENEGESYGSSTGCQRHDQVYSTGADGLLNGGEAENLDAPAGVVFGGADDYYFNLTFFFCPNS